MGPSHQNRPKGSCYCSTQKNQYPLKTKARTGLLPLTDKFLKYRILKPCQSPYNTPILPVKEPNGEYRMVQDLRAINEAVVPIHPIVPNPYTILTPILGNTEWFTVFGTGHLLLYSLKQRGPALIRLGMDSVRRTSSMPAYMDSPNTGI